MGRSYGRTTPTLRTLIRRDGDTYLQIGQSVEGEAYSYLYVVNTETITSLATWLCLGGRIARKRRSPLPRYSILKAWGLLTQAGQIWPLASWKYKGGKGANIILHRQIYAERQRGKSQ